MTDAIETIRQEHRNLDRVLTVLERTAADLTDSPDPADLELFYSIVYYIRVFPDRLHHPKEERHLFTVLRRKRPDLRPLLADLERQHDDGARRIGALENALRAYEADPPAGLADLKAQVASYVESQRHHISTEERDLLPVVRQCLDADDRQALDHAFARNSDPLFGENLETGFAALYDHITRRRGATAPSE
jgi:hemerythrin-like domain-containing protein